MPLFSRILELWHQHSQLLGLRESAAKSQFTHKTIQGRAKLQRVAALRPYVTSHLHALGSTLGSGKATTKELARIQKATACADRVKVAPVSGARRAFVSAVAASTKATFGWLARTPAANVVSKLETRLRRTGFLHRAANPALKNLVLGHPQDVVFTSGAAALSASLRTVARLQRPFGDWQMTGGPAKRLRKWFSSYGWHEDGAWQWSHRATGGTICLDPGHANWNPDFKAVSHMAREAWRHKEWGAYLTSGRHELAEFGNPAYNSDLAKQARAQAHGASVAEVGVLTGAFVSPQMRNRQGDSPPETCPWCPETGHFQHVCWECDRCPWQRPTKPDSAVVARLGWGNPQVLNHLNRCRECTLEGRHKRTSPTAG